MVGIPGGDPLEQRVEFSCRQPRGSWVSRFQPDGPQITSDRGRPSQEQPQPRCDKARLKLEGAGLRLVSHLSSLISLLCGPLEQRVQFCCPPPPMIKPDQVRPIHGGVEGEGGRDAYRLLVRVAIAIPTSAKERNPAQPRPPRKAISMEGAHRGEDARGGILSHSLGRAPHRLHGTAWPSGLHGHASTPDGHVTEWHGMHGPS